MDGVLMLLPTRKSGGPRSAVAGLCAAALLLGAVPAHGQSSDGKKKKKADTAAPAAAPSSRVQDDPDTDYGPKTEAQALAPPPAAVVTRPPRVKLGRGRLMVAVRAGAALPEVVSNFGPSFLVGAEVGWVLPRLPVVGEGLAVTVDFAYSQPEAGGNVDAAAPGCPGCKWNVTQHEASLGLTVLYRAPFVMQGKLVPYIGIGPRLFMLDSSASVQPGSASVASFHETSNKIGMGLPLGADYALGPGRIFLEAMFLYAPFNHNVTGSTNAGAITIEAGYRMLFGLGG
jgi:hypothetical protein